MSKKQVLITGGGGFIGSHLCDRLIAKGYRVVALDNFVTGNRKNWNELKKNPDFRGFEFDVSEPWTEQTKWMFEDSPVAGVLHFACPASPVDFDRIAFEILRVDSLGTWSAVDFALKHNTRLVLASTSEVYGDPLIHPQVETYWGNVNPIGERACYVDRSFNIHLDNIDFRN
ncbi:MAG: SDR family NAD(P)-dependent oxidoreductase [Proteobacteria bacterium]|nr:MAG: SDR family NAD(P)-dependent oxidoreductase [Pseudomonadota bacterium]